MLLPLNVLKNFILIIVLINLSFADKKPNKKVAETRLLDFMDPNTFTVKFHVFTNQKSKTIDLKSSPESLSTICDSTKPLYKFLVHGFAETWNMTFRWNWVDDIKKAMLKSNEASKLCIIAVDWEDLARGGKVIMNYWSAISNMQIGSDIMSDYLNKNKLNEKNFHCIGFSLGAHMCSIFYKTYFKKFKVKPGRITGLDPAGPFFQSKPTSEKLHFTDADFVDIIHTSDEFGLADKHGHMDFYPDLGPGEINACGDLDQRFDNLENVILYEEKKEKNYNYEEIYLNSTDIDESGGFDKISLNYLKNKISSLYNKIKDYLNKKPKRIFVKFHQFLGCSHLMSVRYFLYSINDCDYAAQLCKNQNDFISNKCAKSSEKDFPRMGYYADKSASNFKSSFGDFHLNTTITPPYCDTSKNVNRRSGFFKSIWDKIKG